MSNPYPVIENAINKCSYDITSALEEMKAVFANELVPPEVVIQNARSPGETLGDTVEQWMIVEGKAIRIVDEATARDRAMRHVQSLFARDNSIESIAKELLLACRHRYYSSTRADVVQSVDMMQAAIAKAEAAGL